MLELELKIYYIQKPTKFRTVRSLHLISILVIRSLHTTYENHPHY